MSKDAFFYQTQAMADSGTCGTERFWEAPEGWPEAVHCGDRAIEALTRIMYDGCNNPSPEAVLIALEAEVSDE